jgi:DNA-3-methyladenine glycosylase
VKPLPVSFFRRSAEVVARDLLGATIVSTLGGARAAGRIIETEAYLGRDDPASHAYRGRLHRGNASLYATPGTWYVYRSYGIHWCANLVCEGPGPGGAVLLRAILPAEGVETMRGRRGGAGDRDLSNGPGKLCQALSISDALDGTPMRGSAVVVAGAGPETLSVLVTPRIGITKAVEWPLRFLIEPAGTAPAGSRGTRASTRRLLIPVSSFRARTAVRQ